MREGQRRSLIVWFLIAVLKSIPCSLFYIGITLYHVFGDEPSIFTAAKYEKIKPRPITEYDKF
jgi:hypothetical protein